VHHYLAKPFFRMDEDALKFAEAAKLVWFVVVFLIPML